MSTLLFSVYQWSDVLVLLSSTSTSVALSTLCLGGVSTAWLYVLLVASSVPVLLQSTTSIATVLESTTTLCASLTVHGLGVRVWSVSVLVIALGIPCYWYGVSKLEIATACAGGIYTTYCIHSIYLC